MPPQTWTPFRDYTGYKHVLEAGIGCVHPLNGNVYYWACEKKDDGGKQNLAIYRELGGSLEWQHVVSFKGTIDAQGAITPGGMAIGQGGALLVATSLQPIGVAYDQTKTTGFQGVRCRIPGIDAPWSMGLLVARIDALNQKVIELETALGYVSAGGMDAKDREALDRLIDMLRI